MSLPLPTSQLDPTSTLKPKNNVPSADQVTSSQILQEAHEFKRNTFKRPTQDIKDLEELRLLQLTKRRSYEQQLNKNRLNYSQWMRYAKWEIETNHDFKRGRSILERALEVNVQHVPFWVRYIELELQYKNVNHARNLLNRAVTTLPRTDKFWFMYIQIEESLANYKSVREVFERWLTWKPTRGAWEAYASFEERYNEVTNARDIYKRYVVEYNDAEAWNKWTSFELNLLQEEPKQVALIRGLFEAGANSLIVKLKNSKDPEICTFFKSWIQWEKSLGEANRSRAIYSRLLEGSYLLKELKMNLVRESTLVNEYDSKRIDVDELKTRRRLQYEQNIAQDPCDYDSWWALAKSEDSNASIKVLQRAVTNKPYDSTKLIHWRRYVFLWINLALKLEYDIKNSDMARETWKDALAAIPHEKFTFGKLWIMYAEFMIRTSKRLDDARRILGKAIGQGCQVKPKKNIFEYYISIETRFGEYDRVRKIYNKWLEISLLNSLSTGALTSIQVLREYIRFEQSLKESDRCIELFKLGMSDLVSNHLSILSEFVDFLKEEFRYAEAREVLREEVSNKDSPSAWILLALFESSILSPVQIEQLEELETDQADFVLDDHHLSQTRAIFEEAFSHYKKENKGKEAYEILNSWRDYETSHGSEDIIAKIDAKMPKLVTKLRVIDGVSEEYQDYELSGPKINKFLANARKWAGSN